MIPLVWFLNGPKIMHGLCLDNQGDGHAWFGFTGGLIGAFRSLCQCAYWVAEFWGKPFFFFFKGVCDGYFFFWNCLWWLLLLFVKGMGMWAWIHDMGRFVWFELWWWWLVELILDKLIYIEEYACLLVRESMCARGSKLKLTLHLHLFRVKHFRM